MKNLLWNDPTIWIGWISTSEERTKGFVPTKKSCAKGTMESTALNINPSELLFAEHSGIFDESNTRKSVV